MWKKTNDTAKLDKTRFYWATYKAVYSLGSVCSHVGALLFKLQACSQLGLNKTAPTSLLCAWNRSRKNVEAAPLKNIDFSRPKKRGLPKEFPSSKQTEAPFSSSDPSTSGITSTEDKLKELRKIAPSAAIFTSLAKDYDDDSTDGSGTDTAEEDDDDCIPEPITSLFMPQSINFKKDEVEQQGIMTFQSFERSYSQSHYDKVEFIKYIHNKTSVLKSFLKLLYLLNRIISQTKQNELNQKSKFIKETKLKSK